MKLKHYLARPSTPRQHRLAVVGTMAIVSAGVLAATALPAVASGPPIAAISRSGDPVAALADDALSLLSSEGNASAGSGYASTRDAAAAAIALRLAVDPAEMVSAWLSADLEHQRALLTGLTQLGVPYRRNTSKPGVGFDCSGLTTYAWAGAGVTLVRQSTAQMRAAAPRTIDTAQAGDLVQYPGHVMMWLGVGRAALESPNPGRTVQVGLFRSGRRVRIGDPTG